ncbi:hypothetical protein, partial [Streptomyces anulatus]|uniref:hypothetical protein n=1 Tax=Streptomyces anulatus TaxID=1892 RepID=UPI00343CD62E
MQSYCLATLLHTHRPQPDLDRALLWLEALSRITGPTADLALRLHLPASTAISRAETRQHHPPARQPLARRPHRLRLPG